MESTFQPQGGCARNGLLENRLPLGLQKVYPSLLCLLRVQKELRGDLPPLYFLEIMGLAGNSLESLEWTLGLNREQMKDTMKAND